MRPRQIVLRSLTYYWRTNVAVVLGVATAVAVLAGALLVGDSVRGSLRDLVVGRLGHTDQVIASANLFRERLAQDLAAQAEFKSGFTTAAPLLIAQGMVTAQNEGRRVAQARVYGVDDRFWQFHGVSAVSGPLDREAFVSPALARQLAANTGESILVRVQRPTDIPLESLHGQRDAVGQSVRLTIAEILPGESLGEFSLEAQQGDVSAVFVPLSRLQQDLDIPDRVNTILVSSGLSPPADAAAALRSLVRREAQLEDLGYQVETADAPGVLVIGSGSGLLDNAHATAAMDALKGTSMQASALFTYLANSIRLGEREVPYSLVTALDFTTIEPISQPASTDAKASIVLNDWAARELQARSGDVVTMEYYSWEEPGRLVAKTTTLTVSGVVPIERGDRSMVPSYPGITDSPTLDDWNPPFPVDLRRIRKVDEEYWDRYRTTPKAFVPLSTGQPLWQTRYGSMTSIRVKPEAGQSLTAARDVYAQRLRAAADPLALGIAVIDVRQQGLQASRGATNFGEYFVYFSFFIVVSALLLVALFFKLGIEQRVREVGLLRAVGVGPAAVRWMFLQEGLLLAVLGSLLGVVGAVGYAWLMMYGLRSWWVDAVGTTALALHVSPVSLVGGAVGGVVAAIACIWWTLRALGGISERSLLMGTIDTPQQPKSVRAWTWPMATVALALVATLLIAGAMTGTVERVGAFFGAGSALLMASLCAAAWWLRHRARSGIYGHGWLSVSRLGMRTATYRPGRSVLSIAVIAAATFILISVEAFRRGDQLSDTGPTSGVGGYDLLMETVLPVVQDPNTETAREALNLVDLDPSVTFEPMRLLPGDDASCLNLYEPRSPRIVAARRSFLQEGRFGFQGSLSETDEEGRNPWLLLEKRQADGAIPVIGDANSMTYVLHKKLGDVIVLPRGDGEIRLRLVAALRDSIFQGELLMAEENFLEVFPEQEGYRVLLVRAGNEPVAGLEAKLEEGFADLGAQVIGTAERLAQFHRVENTYLSTFQTLGGLGLLLGTFGLATVLLRNVLERKRELALLGAVGYRRMHVMTMVVAENVLLLVAGLTAGALSAALAIAPAVAERGSGLPFTSGSALLMIAVLMTGLLSSVIAMRAATRMPLLASLRSE
ncbi:MAG TPA: ABC transporter permease [Vicinamibacterales bacterium]|nr:ABC transporter permease [Vicinamibacterales bacterium]